MTAKQSALDYGTELAQRVENEIFRGSKTDSHTSLVEEALFHVSRLERMASITDVGFKIVQVLRSADGEAKVLEFLRLYWSAMQKHFLVKSYRGKFCQG